MITKVREYIKKYHMLEMGDTIVIGVSGGADSLCLLFMLMELKKEYLLKLYIVHINHGVRLEGNDDEEYVRLLCEELQLPFRVVKINIKEISIAKHISEEEAGRDQRYKAFYRELKNLGLLESKNGKIAVAHNKNDRAETVLFNLFRGSGLKGLNGIQSIRKEIIRPIMCLERREIEEYLFNCNQKFCVDATNQENKYTRNRIRNQILPYAEENISKNIVSHIVDTAELLEEAEAFIVKQAKQGFQECLETKTDKLIQLKTDQLKRYDNIIQKYIIRDSILRLKDNLNNIELVHTLSILALIEKEVGKVIMLPEGIVAKRTYSTIQITKEVAKEIKNKGNEDNKPLVFVKEPQIIDLKGIGKIELSFIKRMTLKEIPEKRYTKWFDYDKIVESVCIRTRESGDYLTINEANNKKLLKSYLVNEKIPKEERDNLILLADGKHIMWVLGHRISENYKVNNETKVLLKVEFKGGITSDREN